LIFCLPLAASSITDKKREVGQSTRSADFQIQGVNDNLGALRKKLQSCFQKAHQLYEQKADKEAYKELLLEVSQTKKEITAIEEAWRQEAVSESKRDEDGYALWDQEETTLAQLVMEYGSSEYLYIIPPEIAVLKLSMHSNIPIPKESWENVLDVILVHNGIGVKKLNPYTKQLYVLKQDMGAVQGIVSRKEDLMWYHDSDRIFFLFSPPLEQTKSVFQFFERFADPKRTFIHQIGSKVAIVATKEEVDKLTSLYATVWDGQTGKTSKVVPILKMNLKEMEKILSTFFGDNVDKMRPPFGKTDQDGLGIFPLSQSNSLVLIGSKEAVDRAEKMIKETEEQIEDPAEMTVFLYTCHHSDPVELSKVLDKVYTSLLMSSQEGPYKETDLSFAAQSASGGGRVPDGYPPVAPLVVSPPPMRPGISSHVEIEENVSDHFIPDPKTGTILMTVRRDVLGKVKDLLKKLDIPKKMVHIEVLLFERRLNSQNNFGLNLLKLGSDRNGVTYTPSIGHTTERKGILQFFFHGPAHKYTPKFDIAYNFLMTQDNVQLNAAPSVTTINQTPATISIVEEVSINNGAAPVDTNKGTSYEKSFSRAQFGITIILTPTVHGSKEDGENGSVTLKTNISFDTNKSSPHEEKPLVDRRHIENEVRVIDGETIILGGLRKKTKQDREEKVPFFGEIPGFGKLFGSTELTDHESEMFFFITPKIIYDPQEEVTKIRTEELKKRAGDIPEFLDKVVEAKDKEQSRFFKQSMQIFFKHDR
jgi:general secretion pathway protein D